MNEHLIKIKYGLTIDTDNQCYKPCPRCGGIVCHVKENESDVFCTSTMCSYKDHYNYYYDDYKEKEFKKSLMWGNVFFRGNLNYPNVIHPFLIKEDAEAGKYIVREFELDDDKYNSPYARHAGLNKGACYKRNSRIIAQYYSIKLLCDDGWIADHDIRPDSFDL